MDFFFKAHHDSHRPTKHGRSFAFANFRGFFIGNLENVDSGVFFFGHGRLGSFCGPGVVWKQKSPAIMELRSLTFDELW